MVFIDKTGQPCSDEEIQEALKAVEEIMVKHATALPLFTLHAGIIRAALKELLAIRKLIREVKSRQ